ncbi:hypothetical protein A2U01_0085014, partial [Trifolium medium]|nr:hypothetical protein [Trifolium medium]
IGGLPVRVKNLTIRIEANNGRNVQH